MIELDSKSHSTSTPGLNDDAQPEFPTSSDESPQSSGLIPSSREPNIHKLSETFGVNELRNFGLFGAMPETVLEHLATSLKIELVTPGSYIFREGDAANAMYVVLQGDVEVLKKSHSGAETRVAVLGPGDWFGEMAVIDVQRRSAAVMTVSPARLLKITSRDLDRLYRFDVKAYAIFVLNIAREMSRRLRVADGILADLIANVVEGYGQNRSIKHVD